MHTWLYLAVISQHIFNLVLQTEEAVRSRPAGWRINAHVQALLLLAAAYNPGTVGSDWTKKKQEDKQNCDSMVSLYYFCTAHHSAKIILFMQLNDVEFII